MAQSRTLKLSILADVDQLSRNLKSGAQDVETFGDKLGKWGKMAGAAFAAAGAAAVAYAGKLAVDGVKAAIEDAAAQEKLALSLKNVTGATDETIAAVEQYITQTALATGVADDELRPAFERLVRSTKDAGEAQKLLTLALDVSKGSGKSLESVTNALGKAYDGSTASLGKLGVGLSSAQLKTMSFDDVTKQLAATFGGQAAAQAETFQGKMTRLQVAFDEAKETVGGFILDAINPMVTTFLNKVMPALESVGTAIGESGLIKALKAAWEFVKNLFTPIFGGLKDLFGDVTSAIQRNADKFQPLLDILRTVATFVKDTVAPAFGTVLGGVLSQLGNVLGWIIDKVAAAVNFAATGIQKAVNLAISGINALISAYNKIPFLPDAKTLSPVNFTSGGGITPPPAVKPPTVKIPGSTSGGGGGDGGGGGTPAKDKATVALQEAIDDSRISRISLQNTADKLNQVAAQQLTMMQEFDRASKAPTIIVNGAIDSEGTARLIYNALQDSAGRTGNYTTLGQSLNALAAL